MKTIVVFISADNLKKLGFVQSNVETELLKTTIYRVQKSMIRPLLGRSLYDRLLSGIENNSLNTDEQRLIDDYIIDCIVCAADFRATIHTTIQIRNKTTGITQDQNQQPLQKDDKRLEDVLRKDYEVARHDLICYLRDNYRLYPEYTDPGMPGCELCHPEADKGSPYKTLHL